MPKPKKPLRTDLTSQNENFIVKKGLFNKAFLLIKYLNILKKVI